MNVKRLWVFGDSFSSDPLMSNHNYNKYVEITGKNIVTWPHLLGQHLGYDVANLATQGSSNYQTFQDFCKNSHRINEGDMVIIGWGLVEKFKWADDKNLDGFRSVHPNDVKMNYKEGTFFDIVENRKSKIWRQEIYDWENFLKSFAVARGIEFYTWANEEQDLIYNEPTDLKEAKEKFWLIKNSDKPLIHYLKNVGAKTMTDETNGEVQDFHMGYEGHIVQAKLFYNDIQEKRGNNDSKISKILEIGRIEEIENDILKIEEWIDKNKTTIGTSFWTYYKKDTEIDPYKITSGLSEFPENIKDSIIRIMDIIKNKFRIEEIWFSTYYPGDGLRGFHFDPVPLRHVVALNSHHKFYSYEVLNGDHGDIQRIEKEFVEAKHSKTLDEFNSNFTKNGNVVQNFRPGNIYSFTTSSHYFHNDADKTRISIVFDLL